MKKDPETHSFLTLDKNKIKEIFDPYLTAAPQGVRIHLDPLDPLDPLRSI